MTCMRGVALGAYVLGAVDNEDRHAIEAHLRECQSCRDDLVDLAPLPGLLNRVLADGSTVPEPEPGAATPVSGKRRSARSGLRRSLQAVAAAGLVVVGLAVGTLTPERRPDPTTAPAGQIVVTRTDGSSQVNARAALTPQPWGTRIELRLRDLTLATRCQLVVHGKDGSHEVSGTWTTASYANAVDVPAATSMRLDDIAYLTVRTSEGSQLVRLPV